MRQRLRHLALRLGLLDGVRRVRNKLATGEISEFTIL